MTDTTSAVRTYAVGDASDGYVYHPSPGEWCDVTGFAEMAHYRCSIKAGHDGPQHVAANTEGVVAVKDVEAPENTLTLLNGRRVQVPAEIYPTVRDEQHAYTVLLDELRAQVTRERELRELAERDRDRAQELYGTQQAEHEQAMEAFRQRVGQVAMRYARQNGWCSVVQRALNELGVEAVQRWRIRTDVKISCDGWEAVRESVYVTVESTRDRSNVYQDVDQMDADDAINALEQEGIAIPEGWQFESFDASTTDVELAED